jgi:copper chaperone CopZ
MKTEKIKVQNMHCAGCVRNVENALSQVEGVISAKADLESKTVTVQFKEDDNIRDTIRETLQEWGYPEEK